MTLTRTARLKQARAAERTDPPGAGMVTSLVGAAEALGVSPGTVKGWIEAGCPTQSAPPAAGGYRLNLTEVIAWRLRREREKALPVAGHPSMTEARKRKGVAQAAMAEHELAELQAEIVPAEVAREMVAATMTAAKDRLTQIGANVAALVAEEEDPALCQKLIDAEVWRALTELAGFELAGSAE